VLKCSETCPWSSWFREPGPGGQRDGGQFDSRVGKRRRRFEVSQRGGANGDPDVQVPQHERHHHPEKDVSAGDAGDIVYPDLRVGSTNFSVKFSLAPAAANDYRLVVVGEGGDDEG
jgi:hypothetical protein